MTDIEPKDIGRYLKTLRKNENYTLQDVADKTGFSVGYLSDIELGRANPPIETLSCIADVYGATVRIQFLFLNNPTLTPFNEQDLRVIRDAANEILKIIGE